MHPSIDTFSHSQIVPFLPPLLENVKKVHHLTAEQSKFNLNT